MEREYHEGDIVCVRPIESSPDCFEAVIVSFDDDGSVTVRSERTGRVYEVRKDQIV